MAVKREVNDDDEVAGVLLALGSWVPLRVSSWTVPASAL